MIATTLRRFGGSIVFTILALAGAYAVGHAFGGTASAGLSALFAAAILGVLETSLSFDNAVVNARVLAGMDVFWRRMFLTVGILVAVFGMRIVFPLLIVWAVGENSLPQVLVMCWSAPHQFQEILVSQHVKIAGFGGAFLWMVFFKFFLDHQKDVHWLGWLERPLAKAGRMDTLWIAATMVLAFAFRPLVEHGRGAEFLASAVAGILTCLLVEGLGTFLGDSGPGAVRTGISAFLYLEVLDASFSFDGVVGAFAITDNLLVIALGLGIGAMFVRSLTVFMVDTGTLAKFAYLEHGAFWAIGALALILFISATGREIPEVVSGSIGLVLIGLSLVSSLRENRR